MNVPQLSLIKNLFVFLFFCFPCFVFFIKNSCACFLGVFIYWFLFHHALCVCYAFFIVLFVLVGWVLFTLLFLLLQLIGTPHHAFRVCQTFFTIFSLLLQLTNISHYVHCVGQVFFFYALLVVATSDAPPCAFCVGWALFIVFFVILLVLFNILVLLFGLHQQTLHLQGMFFNFSFVYLCFCCMLDL